MRIARTGAMDVSTYTIEFWIRPSATAADNGESVTDANGSGAYVGNATDGNLIWDADSLNSRGFILGLGDGRFYQGVWTGTGNERTIVGTTDLRDGAWHHVYAYRNAASGLIEIGVDGVREDSQTGPTGSVQYDGNAPTTDSYHYLAKEKLDLTFGFDGAIALIRVSSNQRYSGSTYTVPTAPFVDDANTIGLYLMDEGSGTTMGDSSGNGFDGELINSPTWGAGPFA